MNPWVDSPTLSGVHATLRPYDPADRDALVEAARAGDLWNLFYANVAQLRTPELWEAPMLAERAAGRAMPFTVVAEGRIVGTTRYMRMSPRHRRLEIGGTFYARAVQRTGVNTECKLMLLAYAFDTLGVQCVQIRTDALNLRSQAAIERLGARRDGVLRGHQVHGNRIRDTVVYSIVDREWPGVRQNLRHKLEIHG